MIVQIFIIHYGLAEFESPCLPLRRELLHLVLTLARTWGGFPGGIQSVDPGHQAGLCLGLTPFQVFRYIVFPSLQASRPFHGNEMVTLTKDSSLVNFIAIAELTYRATLIASLTYDTYDTSALPQYLPLPLPCLSYWHCWERRMGPYDSDSKPEGLRR